MQHASVSIVVLYVSVPMQKMPSQILNDGSGAGSLNNAASLLGASPNCITVKTAYNGQIIITTINKNITYEELCYEIRNICRFPIDQVTSSISQDLCIFTQCVYLLLQPFTIKWVDEENDPCTISTNMELDEAIRLYEMNYDSQLVIHGKSKVFSYRDIYIYIVLYAVSALFDVHDVIELAISTFCIPGNAN